MNDNVRLGYACVNMTLTSRPKKLGGPVTTSRTCRKATWHPTWDLRLVGERALLNANDLLHYLRWNEENKIKLFRIGSELFPWHDHYELTDLPQYDEIAAKLFECGEFAREHGHRLTTHPGPFHVLGSPSEDVVAKSIIGLERHSEMFDLMGYAPSYENKINIHVGGAYGDRVGTSKRWLEAYNLLSDRLRARLVLENDDKDSMYSVRQLYDLFHKPAGIPITFDYHHHSFHPDELSEFEALQMAADTWPDDVRQCTHYSECRRFEQQRLLERTMRQHNITNIDEWPTFAKMQADINKLRMQAHSDYIIDEIRTYDMPIDIVIEAKAKELALLKYRDIYVYNRKQEKVLL
jgi:UV DNA damage endonuclease